MAKLLLVEDDIPLAKVIVAWLDTQNYVVDMVHNGEDAQQLLTNYNYDLLILDWELPDLRGISICKWFRQRGGNTPILFLTGRQDTTSKVEGLETGADDYLTKPFEYLELGARIRTLLRRPAGLHSQNATLKAPGLSLNTVSRKVTVGGLEILLTPREFGLLEFLMRHPDTHFSSKALLDSVYPLDSALSEDTVRSCMRTLRKKLTVSSDQTCAIKTTRKQGYYIESETSAGSGAETSAGSGAETSAGSGQSLQKSGDQENNNGA